jgi:hypothetical protein
MNVVAALVAAGSTKGDKAELNPAFRMLSSTAASGHWTAHRCSFWLPVYEPTPWCGEGLAQRCAIM